MADAPVIPMSGERPRRRPAAGARSVLAGADRASGERARRQRRTTPLLADRDEMTAVAERPAEQAARENAARELDGMALAQRMSITPRIGIRVDRSGSGVILTSPWPFTSRRRVRNCACVWNWPP